MNPGIKRTIVLILISIALTVASFFLHFRVITAAEPSILQPKVQIDAFRIFGTIESREAEGTIYLYVLDQMFPGSERKWKINFSL